MLRFCLAIVLLLMCVPAWGATYYVDATGGNDSNAGSAPDNAWKTISKVNASSFSPGDSILFKRGETWWEALIVPSSGSAENPVTFGAYGSGENPIFDGSVETLGVADDWTCAANYCTKNIGAIEPNVIWINGLKQNRGSGAKNTLGDWTYRRPFIRLYAGQGNTPADVYTSVHRGSKNVGVYVHRKNYVRITGLTIRRFQDDGPKEYTKTRGGVVLNTVTGGQVDNCTLTDNGHGIILYKAGGSSIYNNTITGTYCDRGTPGGWGILCQSDNVAIYNNEINNQADFYIGTTSHAGSGIVCYISDVATGAGCAKVKIHNNIVSYPYGYGINVTDWDSASGDVDLGVEIYENTLTHGNQIAGDTDGISAGGHSVAGNGKTGLKIYRNSIDGYLNSGIQITNLWHDTEIYYNVISNCGGNASAASWGGIRQSNSGTIYNNTLYKIHQDGINIGVGTFEVYNNIIHTLKHTQSGHGYCFYVNGTANAKTNICYNSSSGMSGGSGTFNETVNLTSDPLFVNTDTSDFRLRDRSPAISAGSKVSLKTDFAGNDVPYGSAPDIGAYEYQRIPNSILPSPPK